MQGETRTIPPLYHYTNLTGLLGIIGKQEVWATSLSHMEDTSELLHFLNFVDLLAKRHHIVEWNRDEIEDKLRKVGQYVFAFCLSERRDAKTQWKGFSQTGEPGICLGFDGSELERSLSFPAFLSNVAYTDFENVNLEEAEENSTVTRLLQAMKEHNPTSYEHFMNEGHNRIREWSYKKINVPFFNLCLDFAPMTKRIAFEEEKEWRIIKKIIALNVREHKPIEFRIKSGMLVPYTVLPLRKEALKEIIIGPCGKEAADLLESTIRILLFKNDFDQAAIPITRSNVPLRM